MKINPFLWIGFTLFIIAVAGTSISYNIRVMAEKKPTVAVYCEAELISGNQTKTIFWIPEDYHTLEIRPTRGEFWLVATTPRGDVRLMPGVIYIHEFTRQKK